MDLPRLLESSSSEDEDETPWDPEEPEEIEQDYDDTEDDEEEADQRRVSLGHMYRALDYFRQFADNGIRDRSRVEEEYSNTEAPGEGNYDRSLPVRHAYLGHSTQVEGGRTILDEDQIQSLTVFYMDQFVLLPGQVFPLTLSSTNIVARFRQIIEDNKTFGVISTLPSPDAESEKRSEVYGTTAEIFEYRGDDPADSIDTRPAFHIKAKGRQRFLLLSHQRIQSGVYTASVVILPGVSLSGPFTSNRLQSLDRLTECNFTPIPFSSNRIEEDQEPEYTHHTRPSKRNIQALAPFPSWVYNMYDPQNLVERLHAALRRTGHHQTTRFPRDPEELSWWVARTIPFNDNQKRFILRLDSCVQRLRAELDFLAKCSNISCIRCDCHLANQSDIFSMTEDGPKAAYVNPGGVLHETLTVYKARNLSLLGTPSTEYSWFPGYAWTITECSNCHGHLGWRFTAVNPDLRPEMFYGFSGRSIKAVTMPPDPPPATHLPSTQAEDAMDYEHLVI